MSADLVTYAELAEMTNKARETVQNAFNRYADRAPKPAELDGQLKKFNREEGLAFLAWYDSAQQPTAAGGKRSPRTQLELAESALVRVEARVARATASVAAAKAKLAISEGELATAEEKLAEAKRSVSFHRRQAGRKS